LSPCHFRFPNPPFNPRNADAILVYFLLFFFLALVRRHVMSSIIFLATPAKLSHGPNSKLKTSGLFLPSFSDLLRSPSPFRFFLHQLGSTEKTFPAFFGDLRGRRLLSLFGLPTFQRFPCAFKTFCLVIRGPHFCFLFVFFLVRGRKLHRLIRVLDSLLR